MEQKYIIVDCDNTCGISEYPVDDAMALYYLFGHTSTHKVVGVTSTFGNASVQDCFRCNTRTLEELGYAGITQAKGAEFDEDPRSEAAKLIVELSHQYSGNLSILGLGSLTNLYGAWLLDSHVFNRISQVVLMGGITAPLNYHGENLDELNFSCNHKAAYHVLCEAKNISVITGNNCLPVCYMPEDEFLEETVAKGNATSRLVAHACKYRFGDKAKKYGDAGTYCWDVVAAAYLVQPELFSAVEEKILLQPSLLETGWLEKAEHVSTSKTINFPIVKNKDAFQHAVYESWKNIKTKK